MPDHFSSNLYHLCCHYRSVAEVCRKLKINRGQFTKYLNGSSRPTPYNLKRICDFFGVEESEIALPTERFLPLIGVQSRSRTTEPTSAAIRMFDHLCKGSSDRFSTLLGYYHEYYYAMTEPGQILCSLVHLREEAGQVVYERHERVQTVEAGQEVFERYLYKGIAYYLRDRVFLLDYESLTNNEITQTILIPSYKSRLSRLNGLKLGVSATDQRVPTCTRVVWAFLGTHIDQEDALKRTRLYRPEDSRLDADLLERLSRTEFEGGTFRLGSS
ncbi:MULTISPECIES: helix-turn-helix domain-containing protein [Pseudomonas]|uniref:Cro/Cl family transcriptional regulator n=1 Tax=Pseudomonas fluorescens TaxID=294 RepID=A0A159ZUJ6_PSEFL|nr:MULTISPECIES: helix-turn-helix transcriptional regulator [Pseudomonas]AMZ71386.1 Cro/Cl family transcriptional regulator [Pseudomonas fluorescens]